ncbi:MAG: flagellar protein FlaG [Clostridia bacterium]|nr:flagellar protein FlaG [Clostridia bacterium]MCI9078493.1 flagellar protein FlaG [Lachnospiraceae bacterium]
MSMEIENLEMPVKSVPDKIAVPVKAVPEPQKSTIDNGKDSESSDAVERDLLELEKGKKLSKDTLDSAFAGMNSKLKMQRTRCEYDYDEATNRVSIKVYDKDTDELVLEAPPEESIEALKKTLELAGIIVDEKF